MPQKLTHLSKITRVALEAFSYLKCHTSNTLSNWTDGAGWEQAAAKGMEAPRHLRRHGVGHMHVHHSARAHASIA